MKAILFSILFTFSVSGQLSAQSSILLMSYNIRYDITTSNASPWTERHEAISAQITNHHVDIAGLQEVLVHQRDQLLKDLPEFESIGLGRDDGVNAGEFAPIFYKKARFTVLKSGTFWLSPTPEIPSKGWDAALNRICTYAEFIDRQSTDTFWVFNAHFDHVGEVARMKSVELIMAKMKEMETGKQKALIFCGDFNLNDDHPTIVFLQSQMKDALHVAKQVKTKMNRTFNNFDLKTPASKRIDYIFTNEKVSVQSFETIVESFGVSYPSDHFPILTKLKIN
ncbi:MAG: endonuclease/exonuclease/phosphatase family protein [Flavobacteriales bacterium]